MSDLFREGLLSTSRVIWPAEPLTSEPLRKWGRQYLGLVAYPPRPAGDPDRRTRERFVRALRHRLARRILEKEGYPPLNIELDSAARRGHRRYKHAIGAAFVAVCVIYARAASDPDWELGNVTYAALKLAEKITALRTGIEGESGSPEHVLRRWKRARPTLHLALPLLLLSARADGLARENPGLGPFPKTFEDWEVDTRWVQPALQAASLWREALPGLGLGIASYELVDETGHFTLLNSEHR
jgi:hypothetical protein